jgi:hypothetical protein
MVKYDNLTVKSGLQTAVKLKKTKRKNLSIEAIEKLALKHESFGFGKVDAHGLTTHGFDPAGLRKFVRAIESATKKQYSGKEGKK